MILPTTETIEPFKWTTAIGSVAQYALFKSAGAAVKSIRKSSISSADDVSLKTNLDNDVVDLSSSKSNNLTLKTGSDLSIPKTQNHIDVPSSVKSHVDVPTSGVADAELTKVKQTADLNLSTKSSVNVPTSKTADIDLPTVKTHTDMNLSSKTVSNVATAAAVSGVKPGDVDVPKVKAVSDVEAPKVNKEQILRNIEESRLARKSSNFDQYLAKEKFQKTLMSMEPMDRQRYLQWHKYAEAGIEPSDRVKLRNWSYPPEPEFYLKNKNVYDNPDYFNQLTGDTIYPGSPESSMGRVDGSIHKNGFLNGEYVEDIIEPGTVLDRYGDNDSGRYFSPSGASFGERALPPFMKNKPKITYIATKPIPNKKGLIAPWFDEPGMGIQHFTDMEVGYLMNNGYLKIIE